MQLKFKRFLAIILCTLILTSGINLPASAAELDSETAIVEVSETVDSSSEDLGDAEVGEDSESKLEIESQSESSLIETSLPEQSEQSSEQEKVVSEESVQASSEQEETSLTEDAALQEEEVEDTPAAATSGRMAFFTDITFSELYNGGSYSKNLHGIVLGDGTTRVAYCIDWATPSNAETNYYVQSPDVNSYWRNLTPDKREMISRVLLYGDQGFVAGFYEKPFTNTAKAVATAVLVHEVQLGLLVDKVNWTNTPSFSSLLSSARKTQYEEILEKCRNHTRVPSFEDEEIELEYNSSTGKYEKTITDTNNILSEFTFTNTSTLTYTVTGNQLKISSSAKIENATWTTKFNKHTVPSSIESFMILTGSGVQTCATGATADPVDFRFKLKTTGGTGDLKIAKKDASTGSLIKGDPSQYATFEMTDSKGNLIKWTGSYSSGYTVSTASDASSSFRTDHTTGYATLKGLPFGDYYLTEIAAPAGYITSLQRVQVTISSASTEVTINNTKISPAALQVNKVVIGADDGTAFPFRIAPVPSVRPDGVDASGNFTLRGGETMVFYDLVSGTTYTITETYTGNSYTVATPSQSCTISEYVSRPLVFTNTRKTSSLNVKKVVSGTDDRTVFPFQISPVPSTLPSGVDASGNFTLRGGDTMTFTNLPVGETYTATEKYTGNTYIVNTATQSKTITTSASTLTFTNTRAVGSLIVEKQVSGTSDETAFPFRISPVPSTLPDGVSATGTFALKANQQIQFDNLTYGQTYTIYETYSGNAYKVETAEQSETISKSSVTQTFVNTQIAGSITVTKEVEGVDDGTRFSFEISPRPPYPPSGVNQDGTFTLAGGESITFEKLPIGTKYTIAETSKDTRYATSTPVRTYTVTDSSNYEMVFVNKRQGGRLIVSKRVEGLDSGESFPFKISPVPDELPEGVAADGTFTLEHNQNMIFDGLLAGDVYTITETYSGDAYTVKTAEQTATIPSSSSSQAHMMFINTRKTNNLQIGKYAATSGGSYLICGDPEWYAVFELTEASTGKKLTFNGNGTSGYTYSATGTLTEFRTDWNTGYVSLKNVPCGTYLLTELRAPMGYLRNENYSEIVEVISDTEEIEYRVMNTLPDVSLILRKKDIDVADDGYTDIRDGVEFEVVNKATGEKVHFFETIRGYIASEPNTKTTTRIHYIPVSGMGVSPGIPIRGLPDGEYTIHEVTPPFRYELSDPSYKDISIVDGTYAEYTVKFFNRKAYDNSLSVKKIVTGEYDDTSFDFQISPLPPNLPEGVTADGKFSLKHNETVTFNEVISSVTYTITELYSGSTYAVVPTKSAQVPDGTNYLMIFENERNTGSLTVKKTVLGADDKTLFQFAISPVPSTLPAGVNDDGTFWLSGGESITFENLPYGINYVVSEVYNGTIYSVSTASQNKTIDSPSAIWRVDGEEAGRR